MRDLTLHYIFLYCFHIAFDVSTAEVNSAGSRSKCKIQGTCMQHKHLVR